MYPAPFEYHRASSIGEALDLLGRFGENGKLLAGGHSLVPMMKLRLAQFGHLIDISSIDEMRGIREEAGKIVIGGITVHDAVASSDLVRQKLGLLAECASAIGDVQVRNRGTIGGSLTHSDPAADYPASVMALEGEITLQSQTGVRVVKAADFFVDLMTTAVQPGEILTRVSFSPLAARTGYAYLKYRQPASGFATVGVAVLVTMDSKGQAESVRVGITGLAPKVFRATAVESGLIGRKPDASTIASAAAHAADGVDALSDIHASAEFRAELARVYTARALEQAIARIGS
jgi:carbon-monoxide dehydrogenase medium subunit